MAPRRPIVKKRLRQARETWNKRIHVDKRKKRPRMTAIGIVSSDKYGSVYENYFVPPKRTNSLPNRREVKNPNIVYPTSRRIEKPLYADKRWSPYKYKPKKKKSKKK
ncbi:MAG: hypothetical protein Q7S21_03000 [archaeon]|nr:hypothetical protein [archaeon]